MSDQVGDLTIQVIELKAAKDSLEIKVSTLLVTQCSSDTDHCLASCVRYFRPSATPSN